jgi:hypothetical protein
MKRKCYGRMFPSLDSRDKEFHQGKVFGLRIESQGIGSTGFEVVVKEQQWESCIECQDYRTCYDLSMARFQVARAAT